MNIFNPTTNSRKTERPEVLALIEQVGCYDEYTRRAKALINCPDDIVRLKDLNLTGLASHNVTTVKADEMGVLLTEVGLPNIFQTTAAAVMYDDEQATHYIVITDTALKSPIKGLKALVKHELIHMDQIERGDLSLLTSQQTIIWKGETFDMRELAVQQQTQVAELQLQHPDIDAEFLFVLAELDKPWELEAYYLTFDWDKIAARVPDVIVNKIKTYNPDF